MIYVCVLILVLLWCNYKYSLSISKDVDIFYIDFNRLLTTYINYKDRDKLYHKYAYLTNKKLYLFYIRKISKVISILNNLEDYIDIINDKLVLKEVEDNKDYFDTVLDYPLDNDQRKVIVTNELNNIVIAGAGCGKTSTMIGKIKYLIDKKGIDPTKILVISFTNAAVKNLQDRLNIDGVVCTTFHKLGMNILTKYNHKKPDIVDNKLEEIIRNYFKDIINDSDKCGKFVTYFSYYLHIPYNKKYESLGEQYDDEVCYNLETLKSLSNRSLLTCNNEIVKSYEELIIANYFYINGIKYEYEKTYEVDLANDEHRAYHPDFYLPDYHIYLEHFGINERGLCPQLSEVEEHKYLDDIKWKRHIHKKYHTSLIETYSYYAYKGILIDKLDELMKQNNVVKHPVSYEELHHIIIKNSKHEYQSFISLISKFIYMFKGDNYHDEKFDEFILDSSKLDNNFIRTRNLLFLEFTRDIYMRYETYLIDNHQMDFDDMINSSASILKDNYDYTMYQYIIVDEFQDTSISRYNLLKTIQDKTNAYLMVVGDDFQSIYRFSGCDLGLFIHFNDYFPHAKKLYISSTHRNSQELIDIAGQFVMRNSQNQIKKDLLSSIHDNNPISIYYYAKDILKAYQDALEYLLKLGCKSILLLGRNNSDIKPFISDEVYSKINTNTKYPYRIDDNVSYSTIHRAKGLEADGVIICNLENSSIGFPNKMVDDPILDYVVAEKDIIPYEEERRLFYVALTRTRTKCILLVPSSNPSCFVSEISNKVDMVISEDADILNVPKCPRCKTGNLCIKEKNSHQFIGCSNYPKCTYTNKEISIIKHPLTCPNCGGFLVKRIGPYGEFMGCTNYPLCKTSIKIEITKK